MLIFWKGRGLLIPLSAFIGAVVLMVAGITADMLVFHGHVPHVEMWAAICGAVVGTWLCGSTVCKTKYERTIDPVTRRPVLLTSKHTFYFVSASAWAVIIALAGLAGGGMLIMQEMNSPLKSLPEEVAQEVQRLREEIEGTLDRHSTVQSAGNCPAATQIAAEFHMAWKDLIGRGLEVSDKARPAELRSIGLRAYCALTGSQCAIFLHAGDSRPLGSDSRSIMRTAAWVEAAPLIKKLSPVPDRAAVVITGTFPSITIRRMGGSASSAKEAAPGYDELLISLAQDKPHPQSSATVTSSQKPEPAPLLPTQPAETAPMEVKKEPATPPPTPTPAAAPTAEPEKPAIPTGLRSWTDRTGRMLRASFHGFTSDAEDSGVFEKDDGEKYEIPISQFSSGDQAFIRSLAKGAKPAAPP